MSTARAAVAVAMLLATAPSAPADVAPGDRITADSADRVKDLVSPGVLWCVKRGMPMTIGEYRPIAFPPKYRAATEVRRKAFPGAKHEYDYEAIFGPSVGMVDVQLQHATRVSLPSPAYPNEEGFYFNFGAKTGTTEEFFTLAHLIAAGR